MKRVVALFLTLFLLFGTAVYTPAFADIGDGNIDSGDGGMGSGSSENYWNNEDGVRITVLHDGSAVACFDWSNQSETSVVASFVRKSKLDYLHGNSLAPSTTQYSSTVTTSNKLPTIVGGAGGNNITAIKSFFTDEVVVMKIALKAGISYDDLIGGEYKLLLEPVAYFTFQGIKYAMTATEAAKFDVMVSGQLYAWMKSLTHQNLPLSMFLQKDDPDLGLYHWAGPTTGKQTDANIITYLGMALLSCPLLFLSVPLGAAAMALIGYAFYARKSKRLERELKDKRQAIERELPQFASTIRQSLNTTRDVVAIFSAYRRVCGPTLRSEIDRTLNDMMTGNAERAIKALESRVSSPKLGQLTRGLVAVLRGDDQRVYFDILTEEYQKAQNEEVEKTLLLRPRQLYPYMESAAKRTS